MGLVKKLSLKKFAEYASILTVSAGIGLGIGTGVGYCVGNGGYSTKFYADEKQIESIMDDLGVDSSYFKKEGGDYYRLAHNDGESIPVLIPDYFDESIRKITVKSLDYAFGLLQDINPLYSYKLVSTKDFINKGKGVNGIMYTIKPQAELSSQTSLAEAESSRIDYKANRIVKGEISIAKERLPDLTEGEIFYAMIHELFHLFGSGDVYMGIEENPDSTIYHNTVMRVETKSDNLHCHRFYSPNDYNNLLAIYSPECKTQEELDAIINVCREKSKKYRDEYYKKYAEEVSKKPLYENKKFGDCTKIENLKISCGYSNKNGQYLTNTIEIKGDAFKLQWKMENGTFKDEHVYTGKVLKYNNCMVLHELHMDKSYLYQGNLPFRGSLVLFYLGGRSSTMIRDLYDEYHGLYQELEIKKTQEDLFGAEPSLIKPQKTEGKQIVDVLNIDGQDYILEI